MGYFLDATKKAFGNTRNGMKQVIAEWAPEFATDLEVEQMEKEFDKINTEVTRAKNDMTREVGQYKVVQAKYDQLLASANFLQQQGKADKAMKEMDAAEALMPDVDREKVEAEEATTYFNEMQAELNEFAKKITQAKANLESKRRGAEMAKLQAAREDQKAQNARVLAGLKEKTSGLSTLANIYDKQKAEYTDKADASKRKAEVLRSTVAPAEELDPDIAAARAAAAGETTKPASETFEERMARLKGSKS